MGVGCRGTSRAEVTRNQGQLLDSRLGMSALDLITPSSTSGPPHFLIKWGRGTSPQCLAHIGFIKCWPLSRSRETSRPRPGLPLTFRKWQFGRVVTFRATQRGGGPSPPWEPGREAGGPGYPRAPAVHSIAPGGWPGAAPPSGPHVGRSASLPESPAQVCSRAWRLPTAAMPPGTGE